MGSNICQDADTHSLIIDVILELFSHQIKRICMIFRLGLGPMIVTS